MEIGNLGDQPDLDVAQIRAIAAPPLFTDCANVVLSPNRVKQLVSLVLADPVV